jgi:hypothetical protein
MQAARTFQRTGWAGGSREKPTLGELAESSQAAVAEVRRRLEAGQRVEGQLLLVEKKAALYATLSKRFGAETKAHRISGRQMAEAQVEAFLTGRR